MNRMDKIFNELKSKNEGILVTYFPIKDTILKDDLVWGERYFNNGATVLEIGLPYENPCLDGKTVRDSMARAIEDSTFQDVIETIKLLREKLPNNILQIMTYYEIIEREGIEEFAKACQYCGVDAVLSPNTPRDMMEIVDRELLKYNIYNLRFVPYHITDEIVEDLIENAKGYIFLQAVDGATGAQKTVSKQVEVNVKKLKKAGIKTPVVAGFGISDPEQVQEVMGMGADGCIVGSRVIENILAGNGEDFIRDLKSAMK